MPEGQTDGTTTGTGNGGAGAANAGAGAASGTVLSDGQAAWFSTFEDPDLRGWTELKGWKSPADAAKSAREAEKKLGVPADQLLRVPGKDAKPEDWNAFYDRAGRPKTPEDYKLQVPDGGDDNFAKSMAPILHKHGITAQQAAGLNADWNALMTQLNNGTNEAKAASQQAELNDLKREWSGKTYDERTEIARRATREFGAVLGGTPDEQVAMLTKIEDAIGTARLLKLFSSIGEKLSESKFVDGDRGPGTFGMTKEAAQVKKDQLMANADFQKAYREGGTKSAEWAQIQDLNKVILG